MSEDKVLLVKRFPVKLSARRREFGVWFIVGYKSHKVRWSVNCRQDDRTRQQLVASIEKAMENSKTPIVPDPIEVGQDMMWLLSYRGGSIYPYRLQLNWCWDSIDSSFHQDNVVNIFLTQKEVEVLHTFLAETAR